MDTQPHATEAFHLSHSEWPPHSAVNNSMQLYLFITTTRTHPVNTCSIKAQEDTGDLIVHWQGSDLKASQREHPLLRYKNEPSACPGQDRAQPLSQAPVWGPCNGPPKRGDVRDMRDLGDEVGKGVQDAERRPSASQGLWRAGRSRCIHMAPKGAACTVGLTDTPAALICAHAVYVQSPRFRHKAVYKTPMPCLADMISETIHRLPSGWLQAQGESVQVSSLSQDKICTCK